MFVEHLDTQLDEEDVNKITSGTKTKSQIMVVKSQFDKISKLLKSCSFLYLNVLLFLCI